MQPIGAWGWVSDTGYLGVTIYFMVHDQPGVVYQASNAKPTDYFGTDPRRLLNQFVSDYLPYSISDFAHGAFVISNARISRDGRLSLHKELEVHEAPWAGAGAYKAHAVATWTELIDKMRNRDLHPLSGGGSLMAYVEPAGYGPLTIDEKAGRAWSALLDDNEQVMEIDIPLRAENNFLIDNLEDLLGVPAEQRTGAKRRQGNDGPSLPSGMFGRVRQSRGKLSFFPYTAVYDSAIHLGGRRGKKAHEWHLSLEQLQ